MTEYIVYYTTETGPQSVDTTDMGIALKFMEDMRKQVSNGLKITHIVLSAENPNQTGSLGVASIEDGKTPDGEDYTWSKAHRAGATHGVPHSIIDNKSNE